MQHDKVLVQGQMLLCQSLLYRALITPKKLVLELLNIFIPIIVWQQNNIQHYVSG